ncbi:MAG TPA: cytochrome c oxidase subunit 3, partial [Methylovirgula sp.]
MSDAHAKPAHPYHLVDPSPWPIIGAFGAFLMAVGAVLWMKSIPIDAVKPGGYVFFAGVICVLFVMANWWLDVIKEAQTPGVHTPVVS